MSVEWVRFGDVMELQRRRVEPELDRTYREVGVRSFGRGLFIKEPRLGAAIGDKKVYAVEPDDLVVSNVFAWEGAVAFAGNDAEGAIGSHRFMTWTPTRDVAVAYLAHFFTSDAGLALLRRASPGSAGRNRTLSIKKLEAVTVPLPTIAEQRRIAAHLDALSSVAARREGATDLSRAWPTSLHDRLVADAGGAMTPLRELLRARPSDAVREDVTYRITGVYSFGRGLLDRGPLAGHETKYSSMTTLREGDVVFSKLGAFENAVAVVDEAFAGTQVSPEFPVFEVAGSVDPGYLAAALTTTAFADALIHAATGVGARQKRVSPRAFLDLAIPIPSLDRQRAAGRLLAWATAVSGLEAQSRMLAAALVPAARNEIFSAMS